MPTKAAPPPPQTNLSHSLHTLLHTVRAIAHFEDELCTLLYAAEHANKLPPQLAKELQALLARIPAEEYVQDLEAVRAAIEMPRRPSAAKKLSSKPKSVARKTFRTKAAPARSKAVAKPKARKAKS